MQISVQHAFRPKRGSLRCAAVMDSFGIGFERGAHVIADGLDLPIRAGQVVLFTGPSGSGKSSLMRAVLDGLRGSTSSGESAPTIIDVNALELGEATLIDSFALPVSETMHLLSSCGLGEAHLMLRTPAELSDGQRYRFRLALGLAAQPGWLAADEFTATLDRTLAKVVAYNIRRLCDRTGTGFLLATTHEDVAADLDPDLHVQCRLDGEITVALRAGAATPADGDCKKKRVLSFGGELWISSAAKRDWPYFARWHYRSHHAGLTRFVTLLWHGDEPVGICLFVSPPISLGARNRYFGRSGRWERTSIRAMNRQLVMLSRVVLHPTYRGAGIAAAFIRRSCALSGFRWIETLAQMGHVSPFFERAGFVRVGTTRVPRQSRLTHSRIFGGGRHGGSGLVTEETHRKSRYAQPVYYIFDNRER